MAGDLVEKTYAFCRDGNGLISLEVQLGYFYPSFDRLCNAFGGLGKNSQAVTPFNISCSNCDAEPHAANRYGKWSGSVCA